MLILAIGSIAVLAQSVVMDTTVKCVPPRSVCGTSVPVEHAAGRFFANWCSGGEASIRFVLDTGGPRDPLMSPAVKRLNLTRPTMDR